MSGFNNILKLLNYGGIAVAVGGAVCASSLYTVDGGQRAIIFDQFQGIKDDVVIGEGLHFKIPWLRQPILFDIRLRAKLIPTRTGTKDLQNVNITLRVLHKPREDKLPQIYKSYGVNYDERILPSIGNEVMKGVVAQYNAEELITRREQVSQEIRKKITTIAYEKFNLELVDIAITDLTFGKEFTYAVEQKQVAHQESERAKYIVRKAEQEKTASIIRAEGESEAANLISMALNDSGEGLVELRRIEAAKDIANTLSKGRNITYLPNNANYLFAGPGGPGGAQPNVQNSDRSGKDRK
ncbi:prohibitin [Acrasis kona]|uniref:Prohibitin n=1 Tax=Acrasis kona TaxID=1008807 RepID=A0AAW2ZCX5_9EUKA